jgi:hypothetical protein
MGGPFSLLMAENISDVAPLGGDLIAAVAALLNAEPGADLDDLFRLRAKTDGLIVKRLGEADRSQASRDDGATSTESWVVERFGVSVPTGALCEGEISFDKVRAVVDVATPETDNQLGDQAQECSVRELADIARTTTERSGSRSRSRSREHDRRFLRFNDQYRTISVQLPAESYAETRTCLEARARKIPSDGEAPWDQRLCDAFMEMIRSESGLACSGR